MERLTRKMPGGRYALVEGKELGTVRNNRAVIDRLGAYEHAELELEEIRELAAAKKDGRLVVQKVAPGDHVWILVRDECEDPSYIEGYMFLAAVGQSVIVTPYIDDIDDLEGTIEDHMIETAENGDTNLSVFPEEDCYRTREEAEAALEAQKGGEVNGLS